jgi:hypothetical protein
MVSSDTNVMFEAHPMVITKTRRTFNELDPENQSKPSKRIRQDN